ncbi:MAG: hypothetical protein A3J88_03670 [Melioribacter sp. RIFOXYB12_FULL_38_5]|nr:MAG: hypothetical protein A3J88_03670 [Melioribacter sp. RIFOXYB12_FULL_38_5]
MSNIDPKVLRQKVENLNTLPTVPGALQRLSAIMEKPRITLVEISAFISNDPALTTKVLKMVNSAIYGFPGRIASVSHATMLLGLNVIKGLLLGVSVFEWMQKTMKGLYEHSLACAVASRVIAQKKGLKEPEEVSVAGLLHDLGISVVHRFMHSDFVAIHDLVANGISYNDAELQVLGLSHGEIGESLLKYWNIPELISDVVKYHHQPYLSQQAPTLASVIHLADYMTQMLKMGELKMDTIAELDHHIFSTLHVKDLTELAHFIEGYREPLKAQLESLKYLI